MTKTTGRVIINTANQLTKNFGNFAKKYGLTGTQMEIIDFLASNEKEIYFQYDLEREFNIQRSTATVLLQRMEKKGLIERQRYPGDARQKVIMLKPKAQKLVQECQKFLVAEENALHQRFSATEIDTLKRILAFYMEE